MTMFLDDPRDHYEMNEVKKEFSVVREFSRTLAGFCSSSQHRPQVLFVLDYLSTVVCEFWENREGLPYSKEHVYFL